MATNEYKPSNRVVAEEEVKRVETPGVKSIDEVAAFLNVSQKKDYQDFGLHRRW